MAKYTKSKRPIVKTESQEKIEVFKAAKLKNLLQTGINSRLIDGIQGAISGQGSNVSTRNKGTPPISREGTQVNNLLSLGNDTHGSTIEEEKNAGLANNNTDSRKTFAGSLVATDRNTLGIIEPNKESFLTVDTQEKERDRRLSKIKTETGLKRPLSTKFKTGFFDMKDGSDEGKKEGRISLPGSNKNSDQGIGGTIDGR